MSKRILTDITGSEIGRNRDNIRIYGVSTAGLYEQYAVIIADDNKFEGL